MNILILTGKFGHGHNSAAEAIKEHILEENPNYNVHIVDFLEYMLPKANKLIYKIFNFLVNKCSCIYNVLNLFTSKSTVVPLKKVIVKKIDNLLEENKPDTIISVLPICSQYITAYKKITNKDIILHTCITDIEVHNEWISEGTNSYFVPSIETKICLEQKGVNHDKIIITGIPVKSEFKKDNKVTNTKKKILIMGGGLGLIPQIDTLLDKLNKSREYDVTVITGNNKKLYERLSTIYKDITVLGFTKDVPKYMNEADLIITKAGGITMFEAINSMTPLLVIKPFLMQEVGNANYIDDNRIGEVMWKNDENITNRIINILDNNKTLEDMKNNMRRLKEEFETTTINEEIHKEMMTRC